MVAAETTPSELTGREVRLVASLLEQAAASRDRDSLGRLYLQLRKVYGPDTVLLLTQTIKLLDGDLNG